MDLTTFQRQSKLMEQQVIKSVEDALNGLISQIEKYGLKYDASQEYVTESGAHIGTALRIKNVGKSKRPFNWLTNLESVSELITINDVYQFRDAEDEEVIIIECALS